MLNFLKTIKRIRAIVPNTYRKTAVIFFILSLVILILEVFSIFLLIPLIASILDQSLTLNFPLLAHIKNYTYILLIALVIFFLIKNYITIYSNRYQANVAFKLSSEYSVLLSKHYLLGNYLNFKKQKKSSIIKEIIYVANDFVGNVLLALNTIFSELILMCFILLIGLYFYFKMTIIVIIVLGIIIVISKVYNRKPLEKINNTLSKDYEKNISNLTNLLNGFMSIRSPQLLNYFLKTFSSSNKKLNKNYAVLHAKRINSSKQTEIIIVVLLCVFFAYINIFNLKELSTVTFLSVFGTLLFKAIPSINKLNIAVTNLNSHIYSLDVLEEKINIISEMSSNKRPLSFEKSIILNDISFAYKVNEVILNNLNITINKGGFIAINGSSGVGKTTLLNIISKLIDPLTGSIYVDDIEVTNTNKYDYFNLITYLTQNPFIYEGTIQDNLILSNNKVNQEKINMLLKALDLYETIQLLPEKLNSYIGVNGNNLSGGQLQRLCIIRALLHKPKILILDEATNNLDNETETKVLRFLKSFAQENNITVVSVSHNMDNKEDLYTSIINLDYEI